MSEYQYYEFAALDRALSKDDLEEIRRISTRAELTPHSFVNEYEWGDFKGDPHKFLESYYDVMLYYANWGTRRFMLKVPSDAISRSDAEAYGPQDGDSLSIKQAKSGWIFDFVSETEEPEDWDEMEVQLAPLLPVREELAGGDLRPLYLGWLSGLTYWGRESEQIEPPVPAGLKKLTAAQAALARFLRIDADLLAAAANGSDADAKDTFAGLPDWIAALPDKTRQEFLVEVCTGDAKAVAAELRRKFLRKTKAKESPPRGTRTVGDLLKQAGLS